MLMRGLVSRPTRLSALVTVLVIALSACDSGPDAPPPEDATARAPDGPGVSIPDTASDTLNAAAGAFQEALDTLLANPDATRLDGARAQWATFYDAFNDHYLSLAAHACEGGHRALLERADAWPLYPAYVDALPAWPDSGIVNDETLELTPDTLRDQQGVTTEGEVALGFQPLWLLLSGAPEAPRRPRDLRAADADADQDPDKAADTGERRRRYLRLATEQLRQDLDPLLDRMGQPVSTGALRCAIGALGERLQRLATYRDADESENGLYLPPESSDRIAASQPRAAWEQINGEGYGEARRALAEQHPGFEAALRRAGEEESWEPLSSWASQ